MLRDRLKAKLHGASTPPNSPVTNGKEDSARPSAICHLPSLAKTTHRVVRRIIVFLVALLITLLLVTFPRLPLGTNDDSSWAAVLGYAHEKGLQFGRELVFTYGPLGFLVTPYFCPHAPFLRLFTDIALSSVVVAGVCLLAWRLTIWWRVILLAVFAFIAGNSDPRTELLVYIGLLAWGMLCLLQNGRSFIYLLGLAVLCIFASLAKVTFLFVATFSVATIAVDLLLRGRARLGLIYAGGYLLGFVLAWMAAGQHPIHLGSFLANAIAISRGYEQAMATVDFPVLTASAVLMVLLTLVIIAVRSFWSTEQSGKNARWGQAVQLVWFSGILFIVWKHGFVRAGRDHTEIFLSVVPVLAVALAALPVKSRAARICGRASAVACCLVALFALQWLFAGSIRSCLLRPPKLLATHAEIFLRPVQYWNNINELQNSEYVADQLPRLREKIGRSSVDIFGCNQAYGIFNKLNFRPRPVFQSYAAYTERLMRLNEHFYSSSDAPEYVLFRLNPIDDRFPPLEDAYVFRALLLDYEPVDAEGPFLLLKAREHTLPQLQLLREGDVRAAELLDVREWQESNLWLSLEVKPTLLGRVRTFFYQAPKVELGVWVFGKANLKMARFRAPGPMLAAGFLANPLQLENEDVLDLYVGKPVARAVAYSIELPPGTQALWQSSVHFKVYKIQSPLGKTVPSELTRLLEFPGFEVTPERVVSQVTNTVLQVGGKPALALVGGGFLQFRIPSNVQSVKGTFGFAAAAYVLGGKTQGAEFRVEQQSADGTMQLLFSQVLRPLTNPDDRGMKPFEIACPGTGDRRLFLRALPLPGGNPARDLACWAEIGFR